MSDIFGIDSKLGGTFKGTSFSLSVGGGSGDFRGALVQQLQISYMRQITRVWELGSRDQFYIEGHVEGQGTLQQIVGPKGLVSSLLTNLSDICAATGRTLSLSAANNACGGITTTGTTLTLESPVATRFTLGASVSNFLVDSGLEITFTGLRQ